MGSNLVVSVDDLPVDLSVPEPPGDGGVGDGRGDAGQVDGILVPAPLVRHRLFLESGCKLDLKKKRSKS